MLRIVAATASDHFTRLRRAYKEVGDRTWSAPDFLETNLEASRALYTPESLCARLPRPRQLEVFALVAGLPFDAEFTDQLAEVQTKVSALLGERLHYWVARANLAVEYCVFKWPTDPWKEEWLGEIHDFLASMSQLTFKFDIGGVQVNPDGCVVARGFDEGSRLFEIRERLRAEIKFLPERQSGWAHVPLGRILEPVGAVTFARLAEFTRAVEDQAITSTEVRSMKLVHETRWYMEEKTILQVYPLDAPQRLSP
jgi:hypothetical protein